MRGIAALLVVEIHCRSGLFVDFGFRNAYLAVDLFFVISGLVLTLAYRERFLSGLSLVDFMKARLVRLYPMYALGLAVGVIWIAGREMGPNAQGDWTYLLTALPLNIWMLPQVSGATSPAPVDAVPYPFNYAAWSIFFELVANLLLPFLVRPKAWRLIGPIMAVSWIFLLVSANRLNTVGWGWSNDTVLIGLPRVLFSFSVGVLLCQVWMMRPPLFRMPIGWVLFGTTVLLGVSIPYVLRPVFDIAMVTFGIPILVMASVWSYGSPRFNGLFKILGDLSYPIYLLHYPLWGIACLLVGPRGIFPILAAPWLGLAYLAVLIPASLAAGRYYDLPARRWLRHKLDTVGRTSSERLIS